MQCLSAHQAGALPDDSYNANLLRGEAAVDVLAREPVFRVLILGPMLELGESSQRCMLSGAYARHAASIS